MRGVVAGEHLRMIFDQLLQDRLGVVWRFTHSDVCLFLS